MASKLPLVSGFLFLLLQLDNVTPQFTNETSFILTSELPQLPVLTPLDLLHRRQYIKSMAIDAWAAYRGVAWGGDLLRPISQSPGQLSVNKIDNIAKNEIGETIVQSLSTLLVMNLTREFEEARDWVKNNFTAITHMETRHLAPLLSSFALTNDSLFLERAQQIADHLMEVYFPTEQAVISSPKFQWASLEFQYLGQITLKMDKYWRPIERSFERYHKNWNGYFLGAPFGWKGMMVELKKFIQANHTHWDSLSKFNSTLSSMNSTRKLAQGQWPPFPVYITNRASWLMHQMDCSYGTIFSLAYQTFTGRHHYQSEPKPAELLRLGKEITKTCYLGTKANSYQLPPIAMTFKSFPIHTQHYRLNHHLAESYFTLYRVTGDEVYRHYAWILAQAIQQHCHISTGGYAGLENVRKAEKQLFDEQPPEFLSATLKYLYLIFEEPKVLPLEKWVFTLDGHPIPVKRH